MTPKTLADYLPRKARLEVSQELTVRAAVEGAPRLKTPLGVELIGEVDVGLAVQQVAEIYSHAFQVYRVDLKISPVERAVGVVMVDLARAARVFGALNGQGNAAVRTEFIAGVLLIRRKPPAK